jgi:hypothetical protein
MKPSAFIARICEINMASGENGVKQHENTGVANASYQRKETNLDQPMILNEAGIERAPDGLMRLAVWIERPDGLRLQQREIEQ